MLLRHDWTLDKQTQEFIRYLYLSQATPAEYLRRLILQNEVFGNLFEFIGVFDNGPAEGWSIVTSHPFIAGGAASPDDIEEFMRSFHFRRVPAGKVRNDIMRDVTWFRARDEMLVTDAAPRNFKKTREGDVIPFDLVVQRWPGLGEKLGL